MAGFPRLECRLPAAESEAEGGLSVAFLRLKCRLSAAESEAEGGLSVAFLEESLRDSSLMRMPPLAAESEEDS